MVREKHDVSMYLGFLVTLVVWKVRKISRFIREKPDSSGQIIATSAEVTPNGGLVREFPQSPLNSGLGIIVICPDS